MARQVVYGHHEGIEAIGMEGKTPKWLKSCASCKHEDALSIGHQCIRCVYNGLSNWEPTDEAKVHITGPQMAETLQRVRYYIGQILPCNPDLSGINTMLCDIDDALKAAGVTP
ncbi:MAG: hypothetical protein WC340_18055 [Kiritimatiellia bacterium]